MKGYFSKLINAFKWQSNINKSFNKSRIFNSYESVINIYI